MTDAERAWELLMLADYERLSSAFLAGGARFLGKEAFLLGWQKATERAAKIAEQGATWQEGSFGRRCPLAEKIRQQESGDDV